MILFLSALALGAERNVDDFRVSLTGGPAWGMTWPAADTLGPLNVLQLAIDVKQSNKSSIGVFGGYGSVPPTTGWEIGLDGRGYAVGDFLGGLSIGGRGAMTHTLARGELSPTTGGTFGPFLGFKYVFDFGLTFDVKGGIAMAFHGATFPTIEAFAVPIADTTIGWSL